MQDSTASAHGPAWPPQLYRDSYAYGIVLLLTLCSLAFQLASPDTEWARVVTIVLQSVTLLAALLVSGAHRWIVRGATVIAAFATLGTLIASLGSSDLGEGAGRAVGLLLVLLAPIVIVRGLVRQTRETGTITLRTMFGVLCVYLLVGMAFAFAYGIIAAAGDKPFFAQIDGGTQSDFLYFSFTSLTTTGFGDLTAAYDLGRSLTITETLLGQIYLVTVVALIVGNIGASVRRPAR
jgi:Ion channel